MERLGQKQAADLQDCEGVGRRRQTHSSRTNRLVTAFLPAPQLRVHPDLAPERLDGGECQFARVRDPRDTCSRISGDRLLPIHRRPGDHAPGGGPVVRRGCVSGCCRSLPGGCSSHCCRGAGQPQWGVRDAVAGVDRQLAVAAEGVKRWGSIVEPCRTILLGPRSRSVDTIHMRQEMLRSRPATELHEEAVSVHCPPIPRESGSGMPQDRRHAVTVSRPDRVVEGDPKETT